MGHICMGFLCTRMQLETGPRMVVAPSPVTWQCFIAGECIWPRRSQLPSVDIRIQSSLLSVWWLGFRKCFRKSTSLRVAQAVPCDVHGPFSSFGGQKVFVERCLGHAEPPAFLLRGWIAADDS